MTAATTAVKQAAPAAGSLPAATIWRHAPHLDVLALAGRGAFGEVWLVKDRRTSRLHALKQLRADCPNPTAGRQLLWNEAEVGRRVQSEHVIRVGEPFLEADPPYLLLEWLSGETLEARLTREMQLPCPQALWIARQCAQGLSDLLRAGFTHGDLKPSNIFLCRSGLAKIIDLGFARPDQRIVDELTDAARTLSGTPEYMAPEALVPSQQSGIARDLYALGVTLYRMLAGCLPIQGESLADVIREQRQTHAPRLRILAPHVPPAAEDLVHRLIAKQPLRRGTGLRGLVTELVKLELLTLEGDGD